MGIRQVAKRVRESFLKFNKITKIGSFKIRPIIKIVDDKKDLYYLHRKKENE
jgi:hypothetical protein